MSELVRAILRDEPVKMRRLAELFHVDVASMHAMWVLRCGRSDPQTFQAEGLELVRKLLEGRCSAVVADCYEGDVVAFLAWKGRLDEMRDLAEDCCARLTAAGLDGRLIVGQNLATTADVRRGYLTIRASEADALRIWPGRRWFSLEEMAFTAGCREILQQGEAEVQRRTALLQWLRTGTETDLAGTLAVYFLDAAGSLTAAAARLFVHKNTVKYRIQQAEQRLGYRWTSCPRPWPSTPPVPWSGCSAARILPIRQAIRRFSHGLSLKAGLFPALQRLLSRCFVQKTKYRRFFLRFHHIHSCCAFRIIWVFRPRLRPGNPRGGRFMQKETGFEIRPEQRQSWLSIAAVGPGA